MPNSFVPRTVLMIAQRPSDYVEMRRCAVAFCDLGWKSQLLYFGQGTVSDEELKVFLEIEELHKSGTIVKFELVDCRPETPSAPSQRPRKQSALRFVSDAFPALRRAYEGVRECAYEVLATANTLYTFIFNEFRIRAILHRLKPNAIVLPEDIVGSVTPLVIKAGHTRNIPSIIIPYTIANQQEAFRSLSSHQSYQLSRFPNRVVGALFKRWIMKRDGIALVRMPAPYILGQVVTRTAPPDPWMMNSGFANAIAVENEAMLDYYIGSGLPRSKMHVLGAFYDDYLAKFKLNKAAELLALRSELGIDGTKPLLVIGGCPDQSLSCPDGFEFADINDFTTRLADALQPLQPRYEILMRPHPNFTQMADVMAAHGVRTTMIDTARLVALSDVYISFGSATIRWAISCSVPTLNYDVFHYDYDDYKNVGGVVHVETFEQLREMFSDLLSDPDLLSRLEKEIAASSKRWGNLDGKSARRIAGLIDGLCRLDRVPRTSH